MSPVRANRAREFYRLSIKFVVHICAFLCPCRFVFECRWLFDMSVEHLPSLLCGSRFPGFQHLISSFVLKGKELIHTGVFSPVVTCGGKLPGNRCLAYQDIAKLHSLETCYERSGAVVSVLGS